MQGNQFKYNNLSVNLNIISSFQFVNGKNTFFWKKLSDHKAISISHFLLLFRVIIFTIGFVLFCGFLLLLFLFLSFSWQFFYYCFPFFNFFITVFFYWKLHGGFFHSDLTYNKYCYCLVWRSIAYMSRFNELGPLFPFQYRYLTSNNTSYHHYLSFNFIAIFYFVKNSLGGFV